MASNAKILGDLIAADSSIAIPGDGVILASDLADGSVTTAKLADANVTIGKIATTVPLGTKNLIINGDMKIAQRGTSVSGITGDNYFTVDRFAFQLNSSGTWTQSQDTDVPTGQGFVNSLKMQCTTSTASPNYFVVQQRVEAQNLQHLKYGTANAEKITLSFWVKSNKTGTYINEFYQQDDNRTISTAFTINAANTWEKKTITIDGDTVGIIDNDNGIGMYVSIWLATGSTFSSGTLQTSWGAITNANRAVGQVNLADSTSNYINITGVQLEVGDTATPFEHRPYDMELARCQRYCCKLAGDHEDDLAVAAGGYFDANYISFGTHYFPVTMRSAPSATFNGSSITVWRGNTNYTGFSFNISTSGSPSPNRCIIVAGKASHGVTADVGAILRFDLTSDYVIFSAEL